MKMSGFLSLSSPFTHKIRTDLLEKDVYTDTRGTTLRIGPDPYITEQQCIKMIDALSEGVQKFKN
jgi:kynureninase